MRLERNQALDKEAIQNFTKNVTKKALIILSLVIAAVLILNSLVIIPANTVGIVYNPFGGGVQNSTLSNGVYFKKPFVDKIYTISTELNTVNLDRVTTQTLDGQYIDTTIDVKYQINAASAMETFKLYKNDTVQQINDNVVKPIVQRAVERVTVNYDVFEILGSKRNQVYQEIEESVSKELANFGLNFKTLVILDSDAKDEIEKAIEGEAVAQQQIKVAAQAQERAKIEAETALIQERANAEKIKIQAQAQADANNEIAKSVTEELIRYKEAEARLKHGWIEVITDQAIVDTATNAIP